MIEHKFRHVKWGIGTRYRRALARIRERPAYAELRERAKEIENLKSQF